MYIKISGSGVFVDKKINNFRKLATIGVNS